MPLTATHIAADTATVTVASQMEEITEWSRRYFGPWWNATPAKAPTGTGIAEGRGALVLADTGPNRVDDIETLIHDYGFAETEYAGARTLLSRHDGVTHAAQPDERLAYQADRYRLTIVGEHPQPVAVAAARLARELVRAQLLADGWTVLHASAAVKDGRAVLTLGKKGAGKTTTALLLARQGWGLLANDRVFARTEADGTVKVLPWPSAAAIGLGLLDATGLYDPVRERVLAGEQLHPTQHPSVTEALGDGRREPVWRADGKELKPQFFPDQLATWLGLTLATEATAAGLLFPTVNPEASPAVLADDRALTESDVFSTTTEDRYPDIFGLIPATASDNTTALVEQLGQLPHRSLMLTHDAAANSALLTKTADDIAVV
ncbi:hypothetical protein C9F11_17895 [Streptomyces sp. YIM 121038]|uniref:hypothetical protein n=1 Tax=Streptomyces sp. YIM 121038 TaxID=2136401 RepID=UPI001162603E|nr:hypothetical protein [Streptomyces sp. YIM 121038]QCX77231.1 hypothetical protein C9F11_17895 [Streptomyces sp. YIM 121038]